MLTDKQGLPEIMCILYSTVCATIGMKHVPYGINMPGHYLLACKLSDDSGDAFTTTVIIDAYGGGKVVQLQVTDNCIYLKADTHIISIAYYQYMCMSFMATYVHCISLRLTTMHNLQVYCVPYNAASSTTTCTGVVCVLYLYHMSNVVLLIQ